jgi:aldehyde dehydrogenase (NAD+)
MKSYANIDFFYIDGQWVKPSSNAKRIDVINPATEEAFAKIPLGTREDAVAAIHAARRVFPTYSQTSREERIALLSRIRDCYKARNEEIAQIISHEMGSPISFARSAQASSGLAHIELMIDALRDFQFEQPHGSTLLLREGIGVAGLITPWNWPMNQIACKVAPALAAGCTMILKPSEISPLSGVLFAEILHEAGVPAGVFNLVNGDGPGIGQILASHEEIDMISFTGSTRAGIQVAKTAADTVKRVAQELGGKSPNIILPDADLQQAVEKGVIACFDNNGQTCDAPTRMLVHIDQHEDALSIAAETAEKQIVGDPANESTQIGPVVSEAQFDKIQTMIEAGIAEGAHLAAGGTGRPVNLNRGYYVRPTVFGHVSNDMTIAREEIFGPVLSILPYRNEQEAIEIANDTPYGLAAYVQSRDQEKARAVARQLRAGQVHINYHELDLTAPFGGCKQSGNGHEYAQWGLEDYLEIKGLIGYSPKE